MCAIMLCVCAVFHMFVFKDAQQEGWRTERGEPVLSVAVWRTTVHTVLLLYCLL